MFAKIGSEHWSIKVGHHTATRLYYLVKVTKTHRINQLSQSISNRDLEGQQIDCRELQKILLLLFLHKQT
jgi:hypothetical protein